MYGHFDDRSRIIQKPHTISYNNNNHQPNTSRNPSQNHHHQSNNYPQIHRPPVYNEYNARGQFLNYQQNPYMYNKPNFPSQPIQIQPRQLPSRPLKTNREIFGPPQNVFESKNTPNHLLPRPTPMSTTSGNTIDSRGSKNHPNYSRNKQYYPRNTHSYHQPIQEEDELLHNKYHYCEEYCHNHYSKLCDQYKPHYNSDFENIPF